MRASDRPPHFQIDTDSLRGAIRDALQTAAEQPKGKAAVEEADEQKNQFPIEDVPPAPIRSLRLAFERAHMLATLPRSKLGELFTASFVGAVASLPGAWDGLHQAFLKTPREPILLFSQLEMVVPVILLTLAVFSVLSSREKKTSLQYLAELYPPKDGRRLTWLQWWKLRPSIIFGPEPDFRFPIPPNTPTGT